MRFADILAEHWPRYAASAPGPIPARHWRAVEAVLSCRTPRRGGRWHRCAPCRRDRFIYHSCNHRNCPQCGAAGQKNWSKRQEARLLPVPYYLVTITVPDPLRQLMLLYPAELYPIFFAAAAAALAELCAERKYLGGDPGFIAVLHTWTRRMLHHPHLHILVPCIGLADGGCSLAHPRSEEYLVHAGALATKTRAGFQSRLRELHPDLAALVDLGRSSQDWVVQCKEAGRGRSALRYLAAYVKKSALSERRLMGYDAKGRVLVRYKDGKTGRWQIEPLDPLELIRRWLLHVLPKGMVRVRHYGWLSPAAGKAYARVRFLLGLRPAAPPIEDASQPPRCACCGTTMMDMGPVAPARGPPLSRMGLHRTP